MAAAHSRRCPAAPSDSQVERMKQQVIKNNRGRVAIIAGAVALGSVSLLGTGTAFADDHPSGGQRCYDQWLRAHNGDGVHVPTWQSCYPGQPVPSNYKDVYQDRAHRQQPWCPDPRPVTAGRDINYVGAECPNPSFTPWYH